MLRKATRTPKYLLGERYAGVFTVHREMMPRLKLGSNGPLPRGTKTRYVNFREKGLRQHTNFWKGLELAT